MDLRGFFEREAGECLDLLRRAATAEASTAGPLLPPVRVLAGSARLVGDIRIHGIAAAMAERLRDPSLEDDALRSKLVSTLADLDVLVARSEAESRLEARARAAGERWGGGRAAAPTDAGRHSAATDFALREAAAIVETLNDAVAAFQADPQDRSWLGTVLKRQRTLLGSVQIEGMPVVGESLRAVEDLTELIVHLGVPVKAEWLDIFRSARDVLRAAHGALQRGETPAPVPALSRLRTLRDELRSRYLGRDSGSVLGLESAEMLESGLGPTRAPPGRDEARTDLASLLSRLEPPRS